MTEIIWEGAEQLRGSLITVASLKTHPSNPRQGEVEEIASSLARWGQVRMILAQDDGTILAGNHTYLAAVSLGWTHVAAIRNTFANEQEAIAYMLADNRLGDVGEYDRAELRMLVEELDSTEGWKGTGYQSADLEHMRSLEALAAEPPAPLPDPPAAPVAPPELREIVLMYDETQHGEFVAALKKLRARHELEGVSETVLAAVADEALLLNQGGTE